MNKEYEKNSAIGVSGISGAHDSATEDVKDCFSAPALPPDAGAHYSLEELRELASARKSWGEFWEIPEHLCSCQECLDFFLVLLRGEEKPDQAVLERLRGIHPLRKRLGIRRMLEFRPSRRAILRIAASVAIAAAAVWLAATYFSAPYVKISGGEMLLPDGSRIGGGSFPPGNSSLVATKETEAVFGDGSAVSISENSFISFAPGRSGNSVQISDGIIYCKISHQKSGRSFRVVTPAGEIEVLGTRFSVESRIGDADKGPHLKDESAGGLRFLHPAELGVKESPSGQVSRSSVVTVKVDEGSVKVRNRYAAENVLCAGQTAVLRGGSGVIDIFEDNVRERRASPPRRDD